MDELSKMSSEELVGIIKNKIKDWPQWKINMLVKEKEFNNENNKIQQLKECLEQAEKLLIEIQSEENISDDVNLDNYWEDLNNRNIEYSVPVHYFCICEDYIKPITKLEDTKIKAGENYSKYPTFKYGKMALNLKNFYDKLLAFKYCYDKDYTPDWNTTTHKWYIYFDHDDKVYKAYRAIKMDFINVYFSTYEIAEKCANWLNETKFKMKGN